MSRIIPFVSSLLFISKNKCSYKSSNLLAECKKSFFLSLKTFFPLFLFEIKLLEFIKKPKPLNEHNKIFLFSSNKKTSIICSLSVKAKYEENGLPFEDPKTKESPSIV